MSHSVMVFIGCAMHNPCGDAHSNPQFACLFEFLGRKVTDPPNAMACGQLSMRLQPDRNTYRFQIGQNAYYARFCITDKGVKNTDGQSEATCRGKGSKPRMSFSYSMGRHEASSKVKF